MDPDPHTRTVTAPPWSLRPEDVEGSFHFLQQRGGLQIWRADVGLGEYPYLEHFGAVVPSQVE